MAHRQVVGELKRVARRYRRLYAWNAVAVCCLGAAIAGFGLMILLAPTTRSTLFWPVSVLLIGCLLAICAGTWLAARPTRDLRWVARRIEAKHLELESLLLAAMEQEPHWQDGRFGFLQYSVINDALNHAAANDWREVVPLGKLRIAQLSGAAAAAILACVTYALAVIPTGHDATLPLASIRDQSLAEKDYRVAVIPGDVQIERGTSLIVTARFDADLPDDATLEWQDASGQTERLPMSLSLSDPIFGGRVPEVRTDLTYRLHYAGQTSGDFNVSVYDHPELQRADVRLVFPEYTGLEEKRVEDTHRVTAVEGTRLTLSCRLNKPVDSAQLVGEDESRIELTAQPDRATVYEMTRPLSESGRYRLELIDADGRKNKLPPRFVFKVTPNRAADLKVVRPARDVRVSPLEELLAQASVWDDFGLRAYGLSYAMAGEPPQDVVLGRSTSRNERRQIEHLVAMEKLEAQPDQLLSYYFWAEDVGPDGRPRRSFGDMYFAEVRHFEEIFRQGDQPPGDQSQQEQQQGEGENAQQAEKLAELQKQIINATWKVIRREVGETTSGPFLPDVIEIRKSQEDVLKQTAELAEKLPDAQSQSHIADVQRHAGQAVTRLAEASESVSPEPLRPALAAEQAAYQAMLKLRAREHEVTRGKPGKSQSQSASNAQSRAQQQLEQLKLEDSPDRYETQRQAEAQQQESDRETVQVLNRLRELARRQDDLNERMKELQSALEQAQTEEEREDIRRQLKRLREQEEEILRDTDELDQRMQRPENQERMAQSRRDLDQTRENIRQTTEALKEGQVSQAVAAGTRAERQLSEMRDEFRKQASNRFSEEVRRLRDDAQQLDEKEDELAGRLRQLDQKESKTKTLRDSSDRAEVGQEFSRQREDLDQLLDRMQETVREAEEPEPLLAGKLYDAFRETQRQQVERALDVTREALDLGLVEQARAVESRAGEGIRQLRESVEEAAENVLGDEDEALQRAHDVLTDLAGRLNREIEEAQATPGRSQRSDREASEQRSDPSDGPSQEKPPGRAGSQPQPGEPTEQGEPRSEPQPGRQPSDSRQPPDRPSESDARRPGPGSTSPPTLRGPRPDSVAQAGPERAGTPDAGRAGPLTGDNFLEWSDRLRDVEEMVDDPDLRAEAARIRDRARAVRRDFRRGDFEGPNWDIVREFVAQPLNELRDRIAEELLRRQPDENLVPIDRDPVPAKYAEQVRRYFERLGSGK